MDENGNWQGVAKEERMQVDDDDNDDDSSSNVHIDSHHNPSRNNDDDVDDKPLPIDTPLKTFHQIDHQAEDPQWINLYPHKHPGVNLQLQDHSRSNMSPIEKSLDVCLQDYPRGNLSQKENFPVENPLTQEYRCAKDSMDFPCGNLSQKENFPVENPLAQEHRCTKDSSSDKHVQAQDLPPTNVSPIKQSLDVSLQDYTGAILSQKESIPEEYQAQDRPQTNVFSSAVNFESQGHSFTHLSPTEKSLSVDLKAEDHPRSKLSAKQKSLDKQVTDPLCSNLSSKKKSTKDTHPQPYPFNRYLFVLPPEPFTPALTSLLTSSSPSSSSSLSAKRQKRDDEINRLYSSTSHVFSISKSETGTRRVGGGRGGGGGGGGDIKGILRKGRRRRFGGQDQARAFYSKYEPREVLGEGLSSTVRVAVDKATGEEVAVKIIDLGDTGRQESGGVRITPEQLREDAHREIELLEFCRNNGQANVVKLITYYETTTYIFLVFELCKQDLFEYLNDGSCISEKRTRNFMRQLLEVVNFLHSHRIVHRDLKLENLLVIPRPVTDESKDPHQIIKVADFGFAAKVPEGENLHQMLGTLTSMAPEVLDMPHRNGEGYSFPIDLWSCGVIMFTLIETESPFRSPRKQVVIRKIRKGSYNFLHSNWQNVTNDAKDLISKLLVVDPANRYTARQALDHPFFQLDEDHFAS